MTLVAVALVVAAAALAAWRLDRAWSDGALALVAASAGLHLLLTRRAWEDAVRRPLWIADVARGGWLDRGVDWLLAALALALASALLARSPALRRSSALGVVRGGTALAALLAAASLGWAFFGRA